MRTASVESRWWIAAAACFLIFAILGSYVSSRTPTRIDVEATALRGEATSLALFFTSLGRWYVLLPLSLLALVSALAARTNVLPVATIVVVQNATQGIVAILKPIFHRTRPDAWLRIHEVDLSYPSGHAVTTMVFYGSLLLLLALRTPALPRPLALTLAAACAVCIVGIPWSRLALGAHYATDVLGGLLFGAGSLCVLAALYVRFGVLR
ncbi:MAG: phosphatase PAP2 family protein [Candidatus Eremiobacteraeota bacterium]|nr:phosphatase PAP2 family protein [Candidatus Eremiobacteraeota bacterium]